MTGERTLGSQRPLPSDALSLGALRSRVGVAPHRLSEAVFELAEQEAAVAHLADHRTTGGTDGRVKEVLLTERCRQLAKTYRRVGLAKDEHEATRLIDAWLGYSERGRDTSLSRE